MTKERPILFNGDMVRAILDGRKIMTRRIMKPQPCCEGWGVWDSESEPSEGQFTFSHERGQCDCYDENWRPGNPPVCRFDPCGSGIVGWKCPYGKPGDRLWVREAFGHGCNLCGVRLPLAPHLKYRVDGNDCGCPAAWCPSIYMPRWASRITLEITGVRVERVQDITEEDALDEGCEGEAYTNTGREVYVPSWNFRALWDLINAKRGFGWDANPWVWVVEFRRGDA